VLIGVVALVVEIARSTAHLRQAPVAFGVVTVAVALLLFSPVTVGRRARATHMTFGETVAILAFAVLPPAAAALSCSLAALFLGSPCGRARSNRIFNGASSVTAAAVGQARRRSRAGAGHSCAAGRRRRGDRLRCGQPCTGGAPPESGPGWPRRPPTDQPARRVNNLSGPG
jgi:hypothetical protein